MSGVGLTLSGRMLGHRKRETTAIDAHLNDGALRDAAAQAAAVTARTMGPRVESSPLPDEAEHSDTLAAVPEFSGPVGPATDAGAVPSQLERQWREMCEARFEKEFLCCCYCVLGPSRPK